MKKVIIIVIALVIIIGVACKVCNVQLTEEVITITSETVAWDMS